MSSEKPYVVVDGHRNTGIMFLRGRKVARIIARDPHFRILRVPLREFDEEWKPLCHYSNGAPNSSTPYDLQTAARRYLEYSRNAGITESALRCLNEILEGRYNMLEEAASSASDAIIQPAVSKSAVVPPMGSLSDALKGASKKTPKSSTKNGTTSAAKRPSRPTTVEAKSADGTISKEKDMQARTANTAKSKKPAAAVVMKAKPDKVASAKKKAPASKQPAVKKPKKTADGAPGRAPSISDDAVLTFVAAENPKRKGTDAYRKFAVYKKGMTIGEVVRKNVDRADVNYNLKRGFIKIKG